MGFFNSVFTVLEDWKQQRIAREAERVAEIKELRQQRFDNGRAFARAWLARGLTPVVTEAADELAVAQVGPVDNPYNPLGIVFAFANIASDEEVDDE